LKEYRNIIFVLAFGLILFTILSCFPDPPQGPFDARDYTRLTGMKLEQHPWASLIEPLTAPLQIVAGAPDFRISGLSLLIWVFVGAGARGVFAEIRRRNGRGRLAALHRGLRTALAASATLAFLIFCLVMARIPGWRLVVDDPNLIVADLHSHTVESFDGLISAKTNLEWHASCGYSLVGLTEHDSLFAHDTETAADPDFERLPPSISGVEAHTGPGIMVVALCGDSHVQLAVPQIGEPHNRTAWFTKHVHEDCGGAVFVVTMNNLKPADISRLVDNGVDGFEIINCGHPALKADLRRALLDARQSSGIALLSVTDWHGWGGMTRAWTVIKTSGPSAPSRRETGLAAIRKIKARNGTDVIPVVAGYMGVPSPARVVLSPVFETLRYARELSPVRVLSWWVWVWAVFALWLVLRRIGLQPGSVLASSLLGAIGLGLLFAGFSLLGESAGHAAPFSVRMAIVTTAAGAAALLASLAAGLFIWRKGRIADYPRRDQNNSNNARE
jgi:hypothetical protein